MSGGTELAAPSDEVKEQAVHPHHASASPIPEGDGVGHPMVEGAPEAVAESEEMVGHVDTKLEEEAEPAALDTEVAEVVAKEESKVDLPPTPQPLRAISPMSVEDELESQSKEEAKDHSSPTPSPKQPISPVSVAEEREPVTKEDHQVDEDMEIDEPADQEETKEELISAVPTEPTTLTPSPGLAQEDGQTEAPETLKADGKQLDTERGDIPTPPLPTTGLPSEDELERRKRERSDSPIVPEPTKRPRKAYTTPLPASLSHLLHPPTSTMYITNLRRPLIHSALHDYLFPTSSPPSDRLPSPKPPFASADHPNLWLSGVKDHAYATYPSIEAALAEAERIEAQKWPEETGEQLHVEFIPDELVRGLVEREEFAWASGRQKLTLRIKPPEDEDGEVLIELQGGGAIGSTSRMGRTGAPAVGLARPPPPGLVRPHQPLLSGTNAIRPPPPPGAPTGPSAGLGIRGRAVPPRVARPENGDVPVRPGPGPGVGFGRGGGARTAEGRLVNPMRRTKLRPGLFWKEGPGAVVK